MLLESTPFGQTAGVVAVINVSYNMYRQSHRARHTNHQPKVRFNHAIL